MSRSEREKQSKMQEKYQSILSSMLKEEDNKYCVDCDAKSPRWASWNIGIFFCIRCAGFHRNLGVHISKVKSVNLDSWTGEQIASMQAMGNSRARAVYEANLPDGFRRPQADSALEAFIRAKYEQRKWIAKEWIPPNITVPPDFLDAEPKEEKRRTEKKPENDKFEKAVSGQIPQLKPYVAPTTGINAVSKVSTPTQVERSNQDQDTSNHVAEDLVKLDEISEIIPSSSSNSDSLDPLHLLFSSHTYPTNINNSLAVNQSDTTANTNNLELDLKAAFSNDKLTTNDVDSNNTQLTKDKILALYNIPQSSITSNIPSHHINTINHLSPSTRMFFTKSYQYFYIIRTYLSFIATVMQASSSFGPGGVGFQSRPQFHQQRPFNNQSQQQQQQQQQQQHAHHQHSASIPYSGQQTNFSPYPFSTQQTMYSSQGMLSKVNGLTSPTLQSPMQNYTNEQLNMQFRHMQPFTNGKTPTTTALVSGLPTLPTNVSIPSWNSSLPLSTTTLTNTATIDFWQ
ncbi:unnamed protein product [Didymodactylos carnosus]|uniref:Arf-GAP domain-containing protein n=1 Tax=Didymodactylos carnosus TaxID=1234261 RepID=A0A8S2CN05_9BILA|nr:unnamed protein product [Didymodactylos carnosus]CAF3509139.1 unnamed protein product [Didymodactylos carnosus]